MGRAFLLAEDLDVTLIDFLILTAKKKTSRVVTKRERLVKEFFFWTDMDLSCGLLGIDKRLRQKQQQQLHLCVHVMANSGMR